MYLPLILAILPSVLGFADFGDYKYFNDCGSGGWVCTNEGGGLAVTFVCSKTVRVARLWVWTARVPRTTTTLGVENCDHAMIHLDCTAGFRAYNMRRFRARNINHLEFMKPLRPGIFLHDNDEVSHAPPIVELRNISELTVLEGAFEKPRGRCRSKHTIVESLIFDNVTMNTLQSDVIKNPLVTFEMTNSFIMRLYSMKISGTGVINISGTRFGIFSPGALEINGTLVNMQKNVFERIAETSMEIRAAKFSFVENVIISIESNGMHVVASRTQINSNRWQEMRQDALKSVKPGYILSDDPTSDHISYEFINNRVEHMEKDALNPSYKMYQHMCGLVKVQGNELPCICPIMPWATTQQSFHSRQFYELLTENDSNSCRGITNCTLQMILSLFSNDTCPTSTNLTAVCSPELISVSDTITEEDIQSGFDSEIDLIPSIDPFTDEIFTSSKLESSSSQSTVVILAILVAVIVTSGSVFVIVKYWVRRNAKLPADGSQTPYESRWQSDCDEETLIDEQPNEHPSFQ